MSFVSELRRRQVFRTAAWYGGLAWLAVEVSNTIFPQFGLPDWSVRAVIVVAVLGLPFALILAWSFDLTASGARREVSADAAAVDGRLPQPAAPFWRVPSLWIALVLGAGLAVSVQQGWQRLVRPDFDERPGLAVLPFANLSPDPANAYFADGLHEEILATFARTRGLRVISRTSVQEYRDPKRNLREIADALDVELILEGSVRREGDELRLTLQLIDGATDEHLWTETYDRKFREALRLQRTIAEQVVSAVGARLSPSEQQLIDDVAPSSPEAYERYLHALALYHAHWSSPEELQLADTLLTEAIALDPEFALAYATRANAGIWQLDRESSPEKRERVRADIERALALQPDLPDALAARGLYATYVALDPERALVDLERALETAPNDANAQTAAGLTLRRLGRFDAAIEHFETAAALSPTQLEMALEHAVTMLRTGRHDDAERALQAMIARAPARPEPRFMLRMNRFLATGDTRGWKEEFVRLEPLFGGRFSATLVKEVVLTCTEDLPGLIELFESVQASGAEENLMRHPTLALAMAYLLTGQPDRARPHLQAVAATARGGDIDARSSSEAAVALELLGRSADAVLMADAAVRLRPEERDALNGPSVAIDRAWVLIHSGIRAEEGYAELERLVGKIDLQPRWVAADLPWLLLRDDARAQQIIRDKFPQPPGGT